MKKAISFGAAILLMILIGVSCQTTPSLDPDLLSTQVALSVQQTRQAMGQGQLPEPQSPVSQPEEEQPAEPLPAEEQPVDAPPVEEPPAEEPPVEEPPVEEPPAEEPPAEEQPPAKLFQKVTTDLKAFHCMSADGPTELKITVEMSDVGRGAALFWRLHEKSSDYKMDWEIVDMLRVDNSKRTYVFKADMPAGTHNFSYPPGMGESWFEFQIVSNDAADRTEVFADVTFFPCP